MRIPVRFSLMGHSIRVVRRPQRLDDRKEDGSWENDKNRITIRVPDSNRDLQGHTFCHELAHAILDLLAYHDLSEDEIFVDQVGAMLHQALKTAEYR